jgi:hypothetical protein
VFNKTLTIVLPVHNAESRLRKSVRELLEVASELTARFKVLIIDDGSTDATYEVAEELASYFPQVSVRRHRQCVGLGASLEYVQRRVRSDAVIVHDGSTPINPQQVRKLWRRWLDESTAPEGNTPSAIAAHEPIDAASLRSIHASLENVHRQVIGFHLVSAPHASGGHAAELAAKSEIPRSDPSHTPQRAGVGGIPSLPRPKFLAALADFALGE